MRRAWRSISLTGCCSSRCKTFWASPCTASPSTDCGTGGGRDARCGGSRPPRWWPPLSGARSRARIRGNNAQWSRDRTHEGSKCSALARVENRTSGARDRPRRSRRTARAPFSRSVPDVRSSRRHERLRQRASHRWTRARSRRSGQRRARTKSAWPYSTGAPPATRTSLISPSAGELISATWPSDWMPPRTSPRATGSPVLHSRAELKMPTVVAWTRCVFSMAASASAVAGALPSRPPALNCRRGTLTAKPAAPTPLVAPARPPGRRTLGFARAPPQDRGAALGRDDRVGRILEREHDVADAERQRAARAAFAEHHDDDRRREPRHELDARGDRFRLPALLGLGTRIGARRVH